MMANYASFDAFFLDVYIDNYDGLQLAQAIRREVKDPLIVFLTHSPKEAIQAFELNAVHYLVKPIKAPALEEALTRLQTILTSRQRRLMLTTREGTAVILFSDLLYIESFGNDKEFETLQGTFSARKTNEEVLTLLEGDPRFYPLSRSYIVNLDFVKAMTKEGLVLANGSLIPLPREKRKAVAAVFLKYIQG